MVESLMQKLLAHGIRHVQSRRTSIIGFGLTLQKMLKLTGHGDTVTVTHHCANANHTLACISVQICAAPIAISAMCKHVYFIKLLTCATHTHILS
jgi:hypothetical protein